MLWTRRNAWVNCIFATGGPEISSSGQEIQEQR